MEKFTLSVGQLKEIMKCSTSLANTYTPHLNTYMAKYNINTKKRVSMFLAQIGHESGRLKHTKENLNYSSTALLATWGSRYTPSLALQHHRKPELIANHVYGGRMGNVKVGDGWKHIGRGLIQLTGANNYKAFEVDSGVMVTSNPELLESPECAVEAACWYWNKHNLNSWADVGDITSCSAVINTGKSTTPPRYINGLQDRKDLYEVCKKVLSWS